MHEISYAAPCSGDELLRLLEHHRESAALLAGGTDLIVQIRTGRQKPLLIIDLKRIPELNALSWSAAGLSIGAAVSCRTLNEDPEIARTYPALLDATSSIGGIQIQGRASIGGNLCNASPSADTVPALIALGANVILQGPGGIRELPVEDFCTGPGENALGGDEFLQSVELPPPAARSGARFLRFTPRNEMDIAVVNAAASVALSEDGERFAEARIAIGAVAPTPLHVRGAGAGLEGRAVCRESMARAARLARESASPIDDMRGTVVQRTHLVEVLVGRALRGALERARGKAG